MERDFFATAAQVIPALAIVGLIEWREPLGDDDFFPVWFDPILRLVTFAALVFAELAAFAALAGDPTVTERRYTILGLGVGGATLAIRFGDRALDDMIAAVGSRWARVAVTIVWSLAVFAAVLVPTFIAAW